MLKVLFWVVVLVLIVSFFGISLRSLITAPQTHDNFQFLLMFSGQLIVSAWHALLAKLSMAAGGSHAAPAS